MTNIKTVDANPVLAEWIRKGIVIPASGRKTPLPKSPVKLSEGAARRLLAQSRDETRA